MKKIVLLQGAFEIIHYGHIRCLREAKKCGDYLIVALNTNRLLYKYKKRKAVLSFKDKKGTLEAVRYVDRVVPADEFSPLKLLKKYKVDVYVVADEWIHTKAKEISYMKKKGGKIHVLPRFKGVTATSEIKRRLLAEAKSS